MEEERRPQATVGYEVRIDGHLGDHWSGWFEGLSLSHGSDGTMTLRGVMDQAALHGLLARVRDLGITLISVKAVDPSEEQWGMGSERPSSEPTGGEFLADP
jgi:hypothetical protein